MKLEGAIEFIQPKKRTAILVLLVALAPTISRADDPADHGQPEAGKPPSASSSDMIRQARGQCKEKRWRDQENHFLVDEALVAVAVCLDALAGRVSGSYPDALEIAEKTQKDVEFVTGRWRWGDFVSQAYQDSVRGDFRALASVASEPSEEAVYEVLKAVAEDVAIKAEHCRESPSTLGTDVVVEVKTMGQDQDVSGWLIWYKMKIQERLQGVEQRFPQPSSPETSHVLPPGMWLVWATKPGQEGATVTPDVIRVGEGKERLPWTLIVQP